MKKYIKYILFLALGFVLAYFPLMIEKNNKIIGYDADNEVYNFFEQSNKTKKLNLERDEVLYLAKVYYKSIYNKNYETNELEAKYDDVWKCWNVYLKKDLSQFLNKNSDVNYDGKFGIYISDKNGGLLADFGNLNGEWFFEYNIEISKLIHNKFSK